MKAFGSASVDSQSVVALFLAFILFGFGFLIPEPFVYSWRASAFVLLVAGCQLAALTCLRVRRRRVATLFLIGSVFAFWQWASPLIDRHFVLNHMTSNAASVTGHFVVGYDDVATAKELILNAQIGGLFLTRRNVEGRTLDDVASEIAGFQSLRREAGLPSLIITADQEGGPVSHLSPPLPAPAALSTIAALLPENRFEAARKLGLSQGSALKNIGVTMDLAPVCDLTPASGPSVLDMHTLIATRSIAADPDIAGIVASAFSSGLLASGVTPTAKHFPGLGSVPTDTHLFGASLALSKAELDKRDWVPFRAVMNLPGAAVMLSHVALDGIDSEIPASRSKRIVTGILREQWGFRGIAITDDLTMGAVKHAGLCQAIEGAINAGIDLLLVSWDTDKVYPALRCALEALDAKQIDTSALAQSNQRLRTLISRPQFEH